MSTPTIYGLLAGIGSAARRYNQADYEEQLAGERAANEGLVRKLESMTTREDVPIAARNAAAKGLLDFAAIPGMPTAKHRMQVLDPVLQAMGQPREAPEATMLHGRAATVANPNTPPEAAGSDISDLNTPLDQAKRNVRADAFNETAAQVPTRSGLLASDEVAMNRARSFSILRSSLDGSGSGGAAGAGVGAGAGGSNYYYDEVPRLDSKGGMSLVPLRHQIGGIEADYLDENGRPGHGFVRVDYSTGQMVNTETGRPVRVTSRTVSDNVVPVTVAGGPTGSEKQFVSKFGSRGMSFPEPPSFQFLPTEDAEGHIGSVPVNRKTGNVAGSPIARGQRTNADVHRESVATSTTARKIATKATLDPNAFPEVPEPPGLPQLTNDKGEPVTVGSRVYAATREPGSVLQRASAGRSVVAQGEDVAKKVEDPNNADLFGKVKGRISEMIVRGPNNAPVGFRWIGPIGSNDARLTKINAGLKSLADLLTTVHGRRAEEAAANFDRTLAMVNSPTALAAAIRQYIQVAQQIAGEGERPTTRVNLPGNTNTKKDSDDIKSALRAIAAKLTAQPQPSQPSTSVPSRPASSPRP